jgi:DNA-binding GntR family transcriptional regulator
MKFSPVFSGRANAWMRRRWRGASECPAHPSGKPWPNSIPWRGAIVAKIGAEQLVQMFEVMAELEAMAGRLAARRCTSIDRKTIQAAHDECRAAAERGDTDAYYYENERFHQSIYAASRNGFLVDQCLSLQRRLRPYRRLQLRAVNRLKTSLAEHERIVDAIFNGDGAEAEQALKAHIIIQGERFEDLIAALADQSAA